MMKATVPAWRGPSSRRTTLAVGALAFLAACGGSGAPEDPATNARDRDEAGMSGMEEMSDMAGMDMEGGAGATVRLRPGQAERIGLRWADVAIEPLVRTVRAAAAIEYPESGMLWVSPKISGWVERLHVGFEGASVRAGEPLLDLYSPELVTAQEELLLARRLESDLDVTGRGGARDSLVALSRRRLAYWDISDRQIDRLLRTGEVLKTLTLHAPVTGVVMTKNVFEGQGVRAGENLLMIAPTDPVWIEAAIHEQDLPFVREGMPAEVAVQGTPGEPLRGHVSFLHPELEMNTRTLVARIEIPNAGGRLRPGMYATVRIESRTEPVLSVPASAVLYTGRRAIAFMDMGMNRLMPMVVVTGRSGDERVEILSGLSAGDRVTASAQFLLDSESNLMEAMQAMMAQMGSAGMDEMEMEGMEDGGMGADDTTGAATGDTTGSSPGRRGR